MDTCINCGEQVSASFARVFGNNENQVPGCLSCMPFGDLQEWPTNPAMDSLVD